MALDTNLRGTSAMAEVAGANQLKVILETNATTNPANIGGVKVFSENDPGTLTGGVAYLKSPETSQDYRLRVGTDTVLFSDTFNATTQNTTNWAYTFATLTASQPGAGTLNFGTVQGTAATHGAFMRSWQYFPLIGTAPLAVEISLGSFTAAMVANEVWASGLGVPAAAGTLPADGVYFQLTTAGLIGVLAYNGTATQTGALATLASFTSGAIYKLALIVGELEVEFWNDDQFLGELAIPSGNGQPFLQGSLPVFMQKLCTGAVSNTNTMRISDVTISLMDIAANKPYVDQCSLAGQSAYVGQNGHTQGTTQAVGTITTGSTPNLPTSAAGSNTAANVTGLGGWGAINAAAGAATDFIATSYQNPAPTINITGRNLVVKGVRISTINTGAAVATTPTTLLWSVAFGHNTVTMNTTESASFTTATAHAPRRVQLGFQSAAIAAAIGAPYTSDIVQTFTAPIVVRPGEFLASLMKIVVGTATASQTITYNVTFDAYFE